MDLAVDSYRLTRSFPKEEIYGLSSQLRRSAASIAANIAEGYGRESTGAYIQALRVAQGSLKETETHILLAERLEFITSDQSGSILKFCDEIGRMLRSLIRSLQSE